MSNWLRDKLIPSIMRSEAKKSSVPEGLWHKCPSCDAVLYRPELEKTLDVCPKCHHHMRIGARQRLDIFLDTDGREELGADLEPVDRLKFRDSKKYKDRLLAAQKQTGENDALIAQIEGGIKKEVSVGCSVERCVCSICGEDINTCAHKKGEVYGGKVCCAELVNAQDAYEWSFVAVPAQPRAGVLKRCGGEDAGTLKTLVKRRGSRANQRELESLEKQAEAGKRYLSELRGEVKRLMLVCEQEADGEAIEKLAEKLDESELKEMEKLYRGKMAKKLGLRTQLTYGEKTKAAEDESDFRV